MSKYLVLSGVDGGLLRRVVGVEFHAEDPVLERNGVTLDEARVNGVARGDLAMSAMLAGNAALHLAFDELGWNRPLARLSVEVESPDRTVAGRSGDLLFALATFLRLGEEVGRTDLPSHDFVATGMLDPLGNVGAVDHVPAKIEAALAAGLPEGSLFFYPQANDAALDDALRRDCYAKGLQLHPVNRLADALDRLGVKIEGPWPDGLSPFRSLEAYDARYSRVFFGRQREVETLTSLLETRAAAGRPGALIIGASGAGKSSFCLAGILPALKKQKPGLQSSVWRPRDAVSGLGEEPADELQLAQSIHSQWQVRDDKQSGMMLTQMSERPTCLKTLPACLATTSQCRVFVIDQFEELFTLNITPQARIAFARLLQSLQAQGTWVIGTLRSEFYANYLELCDEDGQAVLTPLFERDGQYNLPRMGRDAFIQVITRPAELAGLKFEQRGDAVSLSQSLLADAMATDDALPLLGFALQKLYDEMKRSETGDRPDPAVTRTLSFTAYDQLGGLAGAIGTVAAEAYSALDAKAQAELPGLLNALAVPSADGTRETARPVPIDQWPLGTAGRDLIDALIKIRVLISEQGATLDAPAQVRVSHEALFSHWELAAKQLSRSRQSRLLIEDFRQRAKLWADEEQPRDRLLSSPRDIENARSVRALISDTESNRTAIAFVDRSIAQIRRKRVILFSSIGTTLGVILALLGLSVIKTAEATRRNVTIAAKNIELEKANLALATSRDSEKTAKDDAVIQKNNAEKALALANRASKAERAATQQALAAAIAERQQRNEADRQRDLAETQTREVRRQRSFAIAQLAEQAIDSGDAMTGMLLARSQLRPGDEASWTGATDLALRRGLLRNRERVILDGHTRRVRRAEFSPNGQRIVTASSDGTARVWTLDLSSATSIVLEGHSSELNHAAFSPDGQRIVTASSDGTARVWTLDGDRATSILLKGHTSAVLYAAFSPDGKRIVTASSDGTARVWTLDGDRATSIVLEGHASAVRHAAFSSDGQRIVTASSDETARVWTLYGDRASSIQLIGHINIVDYVAFSPDGQQIVTASDDSTARVWTLDGDRAASILLKGHTYPIYRAEFSPDGQRIVTASLDGTARIWTLDGDRPSSIVLEGHTGEVSHGAFSPDGQRIVTASSDNTARVWMLDGDSATSIRFKGHTNAVSHAAFSPDGQRIVTASSDGTARVWTLDVDRASSTRFKGHTDAVSHAAFSPDGQRIVTASSDGTARVWTLDGDHANSILLEGHTDAVSHAAFSPDGQRIVTASSDKTARVWTLDGDRARSILLEGHASPVTHAAFSSDGQRIVTVSNDTTARVWTLDGDKATAILLKGNTSIVNHAAFSPDGQRIVTALRDNTARVWTLDGNIATSILLEGHTSSAIHAVFSPDGKRILTSSRDNTARVWTLDGNTATSILLEGHTDAVNHAAFSPDGKRIVTASDDNTARAWTLDGDRATSFLLEGHTSSVTHAAFSPDGKRIVTASLDNTVRVWALDGNVAASILLDGHTSSVNHAAFSPDGQRIVTASDDNTARVWAFPTISELLLQSDSVITRCLTLEQIEQFGLDVSAMGNGKPPCR